MLRRDLPLLEEHRGSSSHLAAVAVDHVVGVAVGQEEVEAPVVVEVEELQSPAREKARGVGDAVDVGGVGEGLVAVVLVQREHLLVHVGHEQVLETVAVHVEGVDAHS
jgi:hypothetical protein